MTIKNIKKLIKDEYNKCKQDRAYYIKHYSKNPPYWIKEEIKL